MSIRCAQCGSRRVAIDTNKEGFSVGKAVVGTALFGAGGAVMGINGKEKQYYHCAACGSVLSYPMSELESNEIDSLLLYPENNSYILSSKKERYPNIEWSEDSSTSAATIPSAGNDAYASEEERYEALKKMGSNIFVKNSTLFYEIFKSVIKTITTPIPLFEIKNMLYKKVMETGLTDNGITANAIVDHMIGSNKGSLVEEKDGLFRCASLKEKKEKSNEAVNKIKSVEKEITLILKDGEKHKALDISKEIKSDCSYAFVLGVLLRMENEKLIVKESLMKQAYYYDPKARGPIIEKQLEDRRRKQKEIEAYNATLLKKIEQLEAEKAQAEAILAENQKKIFGKGAKLKKQSIQLIAELDRHIKATKERLRPEP